MQSELIKEFFCNLEQQNDMDYLLLTVDYIAAPTLAGLKPSTLINFNKNKRDLQSIWNKHKYVLEASKELNFYEVNNKQDNLQVIFYDSKGLEYVLFSKENIEFLKGYGYNDKMSVTEHLNLLSEHYDKCCPHEIGIFLGFPLNDVQKFIYNSGKNALYTGYWKVYGNAVKALAKFKEYDDVKFKAAQLALLNTSPIKVMEELHHY